MFGNHDSSDEDDGTVGGCSADNELLFACRPGKSPTVDELRAIVEKPGFEPEDVPRCVGRCLEEENAEGARFLIDHFKLDVNEPVPFWISRGGLSRGTLEKRHMLSIAIFSNECAQMLLRYENLNVGIPIRYVTTKFTAAGVFVRTLLLPGRGSVADALVPFQMLLERDAVDVSEVWEVLFQHGLKGDSFSEVNPRFFPLMRFLRDHPKTGALLTQQASCGTDSTRQAPSPSSLFHHLWQLCDDRSKVKSLLAILDQMPQLSVAGTSATGETMLHRAWRLGPKVVEKILARMEIDPNHVNNAGETALDQVREHAYTTGDPGASRTEQLLCSGGAEALAEQMISVWLPASAGCSVQVRAKDLRRLSCVVDTYLKTEYRGGADDSRDEFTFENLSANAFQRVLDAFVFRDPAARPEESLHRRRVLIDAPAEEAAMLQELISAADQYQMLPLQAQLQAETQAWMRGQCAGGEPLLASSLVPLCALHRLFPRDFFATKRCPPAVSALVDAGRCWDAVLAMAQIAEAKTMEAQELLGCSWQVHGSGMRGIMTFHPEGVCEFGGNSLPFEVCDALEQGRGSVLRLEGGGQFRVSGRDGWWAPVLEQHSSCGLIRLSCEGASGGS